MREHSSYYYLKGKEKKEKKKGIEGLLKTFLPGGDKKKLSREGRGLICRSLATYSTEGRRGERKEIGRKKKMERKDPSTANTFLRRINTEERGKGGRKLRKKKKKDNVSAFYLLIRAEKG